MEQNFKNERDEEFDPEIKKVFEEVAESLSKVGFKSYMLVVVKETGILVDTVNVHPMHLPQIYLQMSSPLLASHTQFVEENFDFLNNLAEKNKKDISEF